MPKIDTQLFHFFYLFIFFFRDFIEKYLLDFTKANPGIVIYLKPRRHRRPLLTADYCKYMYL